MFEAGSRINCQMLFIGQVRWELSTDHWISQHGGPGDWTKANSEEYWGKAWTEWEWERMRGEDRKYRQPVKAVLFQRKAKSGGRSWRSRLKRFCFFVLFLRFIYLFLERGAGREKEKKRNINAWLPLHAPNWGSGLKPRHVPGNRTSNPLVPRLALNSLSHTSQGVFLCFKIRKITTCWMLQEWSNLMMQEWKVGLLVWYLCLNQAAPWE